MPDRYERTLREVFPTFAPGNFTWLPDAEQWVWTTFNDYQWDLDWSNPDVLLEMLDVMLRLSDLGVDVLRLDAVPFLWKREGTDCENLPEVHVLLRTLRAADGRRLAGHHLQGRGDRPARPAHPVPRRRRPTAAHECELAYHNQLMVLLWSSLATGDAAAHVQLAAAGGRRSRRTPRGSPTCAATTTSAGPSPTRPRQSVGWDGFAHRHFLNEFYSGAFPGSFARGRVFQFNPETGDGRISGSAASLCGIETALDSRRRCRTSTSRADGSSWSTQVVSRSVVSRCSTWATSSGCATTCRYLDDPATRRRQPVDAPADAWTGPSPLGGRTARTLEARLFAMFQSLLADRAATPALHGGAGVEVLTTPSPSLFGFVRAPPRGRTVLRCSPTSDGSAVVTDLATLGLDGWRVVTVLGRRGDGRTRRR